mgnify:CR=1 FL=1
MSVNDIIIPIAVGVACLAAGGFGGYCYRRNIAEAKVAKAEDAVKQMIDDAQKRAESIKKETTLCSEYNRRNTDVQQSIN